MLEMILPRSKIIEGLQTGPDLADVRP